MAETLWWKKMEDLARKLVGKGFRKELREMLKIIGGVKVYFMRCLILRKMEHH
jgi:hypothetical protein